MSRFKKKGWLTTTEFALSKGVGISPSTVLRAVQAGKIKAIQTPGGHYRIPVSELNNVALNPHWNHKPTKRELAAGRKQLNQLFAKSK